MPWGRLLLAVRSVRGGRGHPATGFSPLPPASLPFAILTLVNAPYKRGFYCGDDSIRYPYRPDTITHGLMAGVTITATVVLVRPARLGGRAGDGLPDALEFPGPQGPQPTRGREPCTLSPPRPRRPGPELSPLQVSAGEAYLVYTDRLYSRSDFNNYVAAVYKVLGTFLFGAAVSQSLTDLAKYMIGRLRPNFLAVCDPDWSRVNCSLYVQVEKVCRGSPANVTESRWVPGQQPPLGVMRGPQAAASRSPPLGEEGALEPDPQELNAEERASCGEG